MGMAGVVGREMFGKKERGEGGKTGKERWKKRKSKGYEDRMRGQEEM